MVYKNFILRVNPESEDLYTVDVASPEGEGRGTFKIPEDLSTSIAKGPKPVAVVWPEPDAVVRYPEERLIGLKLFQALFRGEVASLFHASLSGLLGEDCGLCIRLEFDPRLARLSALQDLPWELLCRPDTQEFLCLNRRTPVVRSLYAHREHRPPIPFTNKLRVLAFAANPHSTAALELESEFRNIEAAWRKCDHEVEVIFHRGGREELRRAFLAAPFQVLHIMGHGQFNEAIGEGTILLEHGGGAPQLVSGRGLAEELQSFAGLRLVVLNACQTARSVGQRGPNPFEGIATAQVMSGVPIVIAMRESITDSAAVTFSRVFYERLALGDLVESAITEARLAVRRLPPEDSVYWPAPVLFLRGSDGRLFDSSQVLLRSSRPWAVAAAFLASLLALLLGFSRMQDRSAVEALRHNNNGIALVSQGLTDDARREFLAALKKDRRSSVAYANLSHIEERSGHYDKALNYARSAAKFAPNEAVLQYNLGHLLVSLGREEEALDSLCRAVELKSQYAEAWNELGNAYLHLDRPTEARRALEMGYSANPKLAPIFKNLALVDLAEGRVWDSSGRLEKAISLYGPEEVQGTEEALYWLSVAKSRQGKPDEACRHIEDLLRRQSGAVGPWAEKAKEVARQTHCGVFP
jgi:tetratricopeptide (TPR) repeat protein